ncbi:MAG TPA: hypothetical protein VNI57_05445, partial [Candidatus Saccharimonadales bacterium]|nr:hypothetical protein [Candidatus Saccharimonadales bacterium]
PVEQVLEVERRGTDDLIWPSFLPDGRHFLYHLRRYAADGRTGQILVGSLDGSAPKVLLQANSGAAYSPAGFLLWWDKGNLKAQRFDTETLSLEGEPAALVADVRFDPRSAVAAFSVSASGSLVYQRGGALSGNQLTWLDRQGHSLGPVGPSGSLYDPRLSPDGSLIVVDMSDETNQGDLWVIDAQRGRSERLTSGPQDESCPVWSPDGQSVAYCSVVGEDRYGIFVRPAAGTGEARLAAEDPPRSLYPLDWHGDAVLAIARREGPEANEDIVVASMKDGSTRSLAGSEFQENGAAFSPDGRYVAYTSDETGRDEIYVRPTSGPGRASRVSVDGGRMARFSPDMSEIFFFSPRNEFMSAPITRPAGGLQFGDPRPLFHADVKVQETAEWDTHDGKRFLMNLNVRAGAKDPLTLVQGWTSALAR